MERIYLTCFGSIAVVIAVLFSSDVIKALVTLIPLWLLSVLVAYSNNRQIKPIKFAKYLLAVVWGLSIIPSFYGSIGIAYGFPGGAGFVLMVYSLANDRNSNSTVNESKASR